MRILQLVKTSDAANWALQQMRVLVTEGYEVHVAMPVGGKYMDEYKRYGIVIHPIDYSYSRIGKSIRALRKIVDEVKPDIIHSHFVITTIILRLGLRKYKIPRLFQLPGPGHLDYLLVKKVEIAIAQKDRDFWAGACQNSCNKYLESGIDPNRVFLCYYQGSPKEIPIYNDEKKLRKELGLSDSAIMIGMVSYMYPPKRYVGETRGIKGHEDFIEAIAIASKKNPNIYGLCIGGAWNGHVKYEKRIHEFARKRTDHIIFCGSRSDVPQIYPELYCAVQPSHTENLGGAAQAFQHNCPVIATNTGGLPDIVIDGVTGYLVPIKNPQALAEAILKMVANPEKAQTMMLKGKKHYAQLLENNKGSIEKAYNEIVNSAKN